jgi:hypothetical protein
VPSTILIIEDGALRTCDMYHWPDVARIRSGFVLGEVWVNAPRPKPLSTRRMRGRAGGLTNPERAETIRELHSPKWACGAAGSALPWHGRGHRFDPDQVHQTQIARLGLPRRSSVRSRSVPPKHPNVLRLRPAEPEHEEASHWLHATCIWPACHAPAWANSFNARPRSLGTGI